MTGFVGWLDQRLYPDFSENWDNALFHSHITKYLSPDANVLDVGAGAGIVSEMNFRGRVRRVCGIDLDPRVVENPKLDEGVVADAAHIPHDAESFDVVFANNVLEHLQDPSAVFTEIRRVLKPNGVFLFKTPNLTHYVPLIARLTPQKFHEFVNKARGREEADTFPTFYHANSGSMIERLASQTGFQILAIHRVEGRPEYLRLCAATYVAGFLYERTVNLSARLAALRVLLIGELKKGCSSKPAT